MSVLVLVLLVVAGLLVLAEASAPGIGVAGLGAAACLVGAVALAAGGHPPGPELAPAVAVPLLLAGGVSLVVAGRRVLHAYREPSLTSGPGVLLGQQATVRRTAPDRPAQAFVAGAWWAVHDAAAPGAEPLADGEPVVVVDVLDLTLVVERLAPPPPPSPPEGSRP